MPRIIPCYLLAAALPITAAAEFIHPGLLHSQSDLHRMRAAVAGRDGVIYEGFKVLAGDEHSRSDYRPKGPFPEIGRAPTIRMGEAASDATAAYQNALMWAITGERAHAEKAIELINAWASSLKKVTGIDGILGAGLQGFKFANAAEILRYTDSGWSREDAERCERWFMAAWHPKIEHYAYFANANWEGAALQMKMAIAVYCSDRELFEETVRYAVNGEGNGSITHTIVYPSGQPQETTRAQHYAQLGLGLLCSAAEVAWNQGVDLYGWADNRILKGFEFTAQYGLGEDVPYRHHLDRTGKYGFGGRHKPYDKISPVSRGSFWPIFERPVNHYVGRRGLSMPYSERVVARIRPEGRTNDHIGLGTLTHWRPPFQNRLASQAPGTPSGIVARTTDDGIRLTWARSVDPVSGSHAESYSVERSPTPGGPYGTVAALLREPEFMDKTAGRGEVYHYAIRAANAVGESSASAEFPAGAGLPATWSSVDIGGVGVAGFVEYNGETFTLEGEGHDIGGNADSLHFAYAPMTGDGSITARIVLPISSQWAKPGVMMRQTLDAHSPHASVLLLPRDWSATLVTRSDARGDTAAAGATKLGEPYVEKNNRLLKPYWVRLTRSGDTFTGFMSADGLHWRELASAVIPMAATLHVGLPACSQISKVTTTVTYDSVSIPGWKMETAIPAESR